MKTNNTIQEIRRTNLRLLIEESDDKTAIALAKRCDTSASYLSQILIRFKMASGKSREVGTGLARKLEKGCKKPKGWMDSVHHDGEVQASENEIVDLYYAMDDKMRQVLIEQAKMILKISKK
jgi:hypothetical protein